ncbi:hypothetical protein HMPREF9440_00605 [Sutterella parvirubra YIT 11816]|uniref:Uncharacterized protein n=1 Tax=Sutterella parvirubra YIT 11816 TaxID=762967 RepID=H3KD01_9BURK|nr:hypothetical protein HMPREF9440_00605 [Sutterella parvirubra YIT 11816]
MRRLLVFSFSRASSPQRALKPVPADCRAGAERRSGGALKRLKPLKMLSNPRFGRGSPRRSPPCGAA